MEGRFMEAGEATGNTKSDIAHNDVSKRKSRKRENHPNIAIETTPAVIATVDMTRQEKKHRH